MTNNRCYGSIQHVYCVGFTDTLTMSVSLQSLKPLAADFDGKPFNCYYYNSSNYLDTLPSLKLLNCWEPHQQLMVNFVRQSAAKLLFYKRTFNDYRNGRCNRNIILSNGVE